MKQAAIRIAVSAGETWCLSGPSVALTVISASLWPEISDAAPTVAQERADRPPSDPDWSM